MPAIPSATAEGAPPGGPRKGAFYSLVDQKFTGPAGFDARGASMSCREPVEQTNMASKRPQTAQLHGRTKPV